MGGAGSVISLGFPSNGSASSDAVHSEKSEVVITNMPDLVNCMRLFQHDTAGNIIILLGEGMDSQDSVEDKHSYYEVFLFQEAKDILRSYQYDPVSQREQGPKKVEEDVYVPHSKYMACEDNQPKWISPFKRFPPEKIDKSLSKG